MGQTEPFVLDSTFLAEASLGALAYGITSGHSHLPNWRLLLLVEGLPTIVMAAVAFVYLPDAPDKARFLNDQEKNIAKARGVRQVGDGKRVGGIVWKDIGAALLDLKCWFTAVRSTRSFYTGDCLLCVVIGNFFGAILRLWSYDLSVCNLLTRFKFMYFSTNVGFSSLPGIYLAIRKS